MHVYESNGNLHIVGGLANGQLDVKGNDIVEKALHLTMPIDRALKFLPEIVSSLPTLAEEQKSESHDLQRFNDPNEFEGNGLHFKI